MLITNLATRAVLTCQGRTFFCFFCLTSLRKFASATSCSAGYYSSSGTDAAGSCTLCSTGYFSTTGASTCAATLHDFDFRGCTTGAAISDAFSYTATPYNGPTCSSYGMYFDGVDDYLQLTNWYWGGATSFEVFIKFEAFKSWSRIFEFADTGGAHFVNLANCETSSATRFAGISTFELCNDY